MSRHNVNLVSIGELSVRESLSTSFDILDGF